MIFCRCWMFSDFGFGSVTSEIQSRIIIISNSKSSLKIYTLINNQIDIPM